MSLFKGTHMRRIDLVTATLEGWSRLNPQQRQRFFEAGLKAALRLQPLAFRAWLLRRLRNPPLAAPVDLTRFTISDRDMAALLKQLPLREDATTTEP
jgi:hypothetical protein